jgi:hypothetical protein
LLLQKVSQVVEIAGVWACMHPEVCNNGCLTTKSC